MVGKVSEFEGGCVGWMDGWMDVGGSPMFGGGGNECEVSLEVVL